MITLSFSGVKSVTLRNPDFNNQQNIEISRINRKTTGGDLIIFRNPVWPTTEVLDYKFSFLSQIDVNNLLEFIYQTLGQIVTLVDYEGVIWTGIIITPAAEITQPGRDNHAAHFQFQGTPSYILI